MFFGSYVMSWFSDKTAKKRVRKINEPCKHTAAWVPIYFTSNLARGFNLCYFLYLFGN